MIINIRNECKDENNIHKGKIFERYRDLYSIINLVNEHYDELSQKGFELHSVWYHFWEVITRNPMSEDEKMNAFLGLVNGTMKFHPIYEYKAIGYTIKPIDFNETLVNNTRTTYDEEMALIQNDIIFEINGEGKEQKVVRNKYNTDNFV